MKTYEQMFEEFDKRVREELKAGLQSCKPDQRDLFVKMYARGKQVTVEETVDHMPHQKLKWATHQVLNTLAKHGAPKPGA